MQNAAETKEAMPKLEMRSLDIPLYEGPQGGRRAKQSTRLLLLIVVVVVIGLGYLAGTAQASGAGCTPASKQAPAGGGVDVASPSCSSRRGR